MLSPTSPHRSTSRPKTSARGVCIRSWKSFSMRSASRAQTLSPSNNALMPITSTACSPRPSRIKTSADTSYEGKRKKGERENQQDHSFFCLLLYYFFLHFRLRQASPAAAPRRAHPAAY